MMLAVWTVSRDSQWMNLNIQMVIYAPDNRR